MRKATFGVGLFVVALCAAWGSEALFSSTQVTQTPSRLSRNGSQAGRFQIVMLNTFNGQDREESNVPPDTLLLDTETGCVWNLSSVKAPVGGGSVWLVGYDFEGIPTGQDARVKPFHATPHMSYEDMFAEMTVAYDGNQKQQSSDCDAARFAALRSALK